ncbi:MAG: Trm112 family protein [Planctomycetota bacterium]
MIDPELLAMLVCPATRQPLRCASADELAAANARCAAGALRNRGGEAVAEPLDGALATADGGWLYPIRFGFPILLAPEAIPTGDRQTP